MSRTLTFEIIMDTRLDGTREKLIEWDNKLQDTLNRHPCLTVNTGDIRELDWPGETKQWRKRYWIKKHNRTLTWNDVYGLVNRSYNKAVVFDFVKPIRLN